MSDRAVVSLDALDVSVWEHAERGELGEAFRLLWEADELPGLAAGQQRIRAELQAYCGNESAALSLLADVADEDGSCAIVRARVSAARGDWEDAFEHSLQATDGAYGAVRALFLAARAGVELHRAEQARELLDRIEPDAPTTDLAVAALRARLSNDDPVAALTPIIERAQALGADRICAEAWADLSELHHVRGKPEEARASALRAVELWDDMATSLPPPLRAGFWCDAKRQSVRARCKQRRVEPRPSSKNALAPLLANLRRLASERDLPKLLSIITDGAVALSGAERGFVLLVDERGALEAKTIRGAQNQLGEQTAAFSRSIAETVLIDGDPVVTVDASHDARVQDYMSVHQLMLKSVACLPIESRERTWGVLYLEHRSASGRFSGTDMTVLRAYADQAAIAMETSQLLERIEAQKQELERANIALRDANAHLEQRLHGQTEALQRTQREIASLQASTSGGERWGLVGASESMRTVYALLDRIAGSEVPVVVTGESGTGKELIARAIHRGSLRAEGPWVSLNCGAIPEGILESELFGHVPGAFTGAASGREGVFVQADGGTLFLDEIEEMPARMQLDLLRVLQERRVRPVGGAEEKRVDVRLVTASKRPLRELVDDGSLREDLFYRLAVVELDLPPLRERRADIPLLCDHFLRRIAEERAEPMKRLSREAVERLCAHDYPGNVRELEHLLVNATIFAASSCIEAEELAIEPSRASAPSDGDPSNYASFKEAERDRILASLNMHGWNRAKAARALGMARRTFYRRLKEHQIVLPQGKGGKDDATQP